jgi:hypothetical protein
MGSDDVDGMGEQATTKKVCSAARKVEGRS